MGHTTSTVNRLLCTSLNGNSRWGFFYSKLTCWLPIIKCLGFNLAPFHNFFLLSQPLRLCIFHHFVLVYELYGIPAFQCVIYHINYFIRKLFVDSRYATITSNFFSLSQYSCIARILKGCVLSVAIDQSKSGLSFALGKIK